MPTDLNREGLEAAARAIFQGSIYHGYDAETKASEWTRTENLHRAHAEAAIRAYLAHAKPDTAALVETARQVCWFDWSDNDPDAVATIEVLRTALSTVPAKSAAAVGEGWQPIESAPKDGNAVDVWAWNDIYAIGRRFTDCAWVDGRWISAADKTHDYQDQGTVPGSVTHWMPLPARPADGGR